MHMSVYSVAGLLCIHRKKDTRLCIELDSIWQVRLTQNVLIIVTDYGNFYYRLFFSTIYAAARTKHRIEDLLRGDEDLWEHLESL